MRFLRLMIILISAVAMLTPSMADAARHSRHRASKSVAWGVNDPRYSAIVMNPVTGEVYNQKDANGRRYPASLTKMMTLYLLFEALENKKVSLGTKLEVSDYATTQPQTNLALSAGDEIPVDTVIKALVVRSANDVAVVVAEALGGDVDNFAKMMTRKARVLGMSNTVFMNPNGLPNSAQYTTAHDMAKLGIALKRDFPRYYPYFAVRQFSWAGTSYYTHNRVMLRYAGVDGIKTGFIGASGFNLVTSCVRGGRPVVAAVMGGASGAWRDNRMIELLDQAYETLAARGAAKGVAIPANLPLPKNGIQPKNPVADASDGDDQSADTAPDTADDMTPVPLPTVAKPTVTSPQTPQITAPTEPKLLKPVATTVVNGSLPATTPFAKAMAVAVPAKVVTPTPPVVNPPAAAASADTSPTWGIQVGAFSTKPLASSAAQQAYRLAFKHLKGARVSPMQPDAAGGDNNFRARLQDITEEQANNACALLKANHSPCFTWKMPTGW